MITNLEKKRPQLSMWLTLTEQSDMMVRMNKINKAMEVTILQTSDTVIQSKSPACSQCMPCAIQSMKKGHSLRKINAPSNIKTNAEQMIKYIDLMNEVLPNSLQRVSNSYLQQHWRQQQTLFAIMQFIDIFIYIYICAANLVMILLKS